MKKILKIHMDSGKSINSFEMKIAINFDQFVNNFPVLLLCKINILIKLNMADFLMVFVSFKSVPNFHQSSLLTWNVRHTPVIGYSNNGVKSIFKLIKKLEL